MYASCILYQICIIMNHIFTIKAIGTIEKSSYFIYLCNAYMYYMHFAIKISSLAFETPYYMHFYIANKVMICNAKYV